MPVELFQSLRALGTTHKPAITRDILWSKMTESALPCAFLETDALRKDLPSTEP